MNRCIKAVVSSNNPVLHLQYPTNNYTMAAANGRMIYRNHDAALGRFIAVDPEPESAESLTTYNYSGNNTIIYNDPMGNAMSVQQFNSVVSQLFDTPFGGSYSAETGEMSEYTSNDGAIQSNIGGSTYTVDQNGYIKKVGASGSKNNYLYIGTANINEDHYSVSSQDINLDNTQYGGNYSYWQVSNSRTAFNLFIFLAQHTSVEWSVITSDDYENYISTSHSRNSESGLAPLLNNVVEWLNKWEPNESKVVEAYHNHPIDENSGMIHGPSGFSWDNTNTMNNTGDRSVARFFGAYFYYHIFIYWGVYDVQLNRFYYYDYNKIRGESDNK